MLEKYWIFLTSRSVFRTLTLQLLYYLSCRLSNLWLASAINRELKQPQRWRQQQRLKFLYLAMKNNSFARFARVILVYVHFATILVLPTTWNDLTVLPSCGRHEHILTNVQFCLLISEALVPIWFQDTLNTFFKRNDWLIETEMIAETQSFIFRQLPRCRRLRVCLSSLISQR